MTDIDTHARAHFARALDRMMLDAVGPAFISSVPVPDPEPLTAAKLLAIARSMPKPPPRVVQVEPFHRVEVYTGDAVLEVAEPNPAYALIPSGKAVPASLPRFRYPPIRSGPNGIEVSTDDADWGWDKGGEEVLFVRADEWRKANS